MEKVPRDAPTYCIDVFIFLVALHLEFINLLMLVMHDGLPDVCINRYAFQRTVLFPKAFFTKQDFMGGWRIRKSLSEHDHMRIDATLGMFQHIKRRRTAEASTSKCSLVLICAYGVEDLSSHKTRG